MARSNLHAVKIACVKKLLSTKVARVKQADEQAVANPGGKQRFMDTVRDNKNEFALAQRENFRRNYPAAPAGMGMGGYAGLGALAGGGLGALYGAISPGEDEDGKKKNRTSQSILRALMGAGLGAGAGAGAHYLMKQSSSVSSSAQLGVKLAAHRRLVKVAEGGFLSGSMEALGNSRVAYALQQLLRTGTYGALGGAAGFGLGGLGGAAHGYMNPHYDKDGKKKSVSTALGRGILGAAGGGVVGAGLGTTGAVMTRQPWQP